MYQLGGIRVWSTLSGRRASCLVLLDLRKVPQEKVHGAWEAQAWAQEGGNVKSGVAAEASGCLYPLGFFWVFHLIKYVEDIFQRFPSELGVGGRGGARNHFGSWIPCKPAAMV